jgi:5-methylcytosine-specific restriction endonuclease McrA
MIDACSWCEKPVRPNRKKLEITCTSCRARLGQGSCKVYPRNCRACGRLFIGRSSVAVACSDPECKRRSRVMIIMARYRSDLEFRSRAISVAQNRHAKEHLGLGAIPTASLVTYLMARDHRRCGICHQPVRAKTGPRGPSVDHIQPLSRGGGHVLENLQLAHLVCNRSKGNRGGGEQPLLFG